jgi:hypothetical protein
MSSYGSTDYAYLTKMGFLLGVGLLAFGVGGEILVHVLLDEIPGWENIFTYSEASGIVVGFFSVAFFGVYLPLTE